MKPEKLKHIEIISQKVVNARRDAQGEIKVLHDLEVAKTFGDVEIPDLFSTTIMGGFDNGVCEEKNVSILGELQAFEPFLMGYVSALSKPRNRDKNEFHNWTLRLHNYRIFEITHVQEWYEDDENSFNKLKRYTELLDYLRLLLIEYIHVNFE